MDASLSSSPPKKRKENHYDAATGGGVGAVGTSRGGGPTPTASSAAAAGGGFSSSGSPYPMMPPFSSPQSVPQPFSYGTGGPISGYGYPTHYGTAGRPHSNAATAAYHPRSGPPPPHMSQSYGNSTGTPVGHMSQSNMYCQTANMDGTNGYPMNSGGTSGGTYPLRGGGSSNNPNSYGASSTSTTRSIPSSSGGMVNVTTMVPSGMISSSGKIDSMSVSARSVSSASQRDNSDAANRDKGRGNYRCGKCGVPKKGHVCPYQPKLKRRSDEPPPEMRNIATQVEMDEFLVVRRLNLEIQGLPESYTAAPMGDVGAEVHPPHAGMASQQSQHLQQQQQQQQQQQSMQFSSSSMVPSPTSHQGGMHPQSLGGNVNVPPNLVMHPSNRVMQLQESGMILVGGPGSILSMNMGEKSMASQSVVDVGIGGGDEDGDGNVREINVATRSHGTEIPSGGDECPL
mmetsp:Transcript_15515/g.29267  ORF Transcript_15515/g.29267 Transcript_15515/m.29267 type:complete len:456 (+) Transcript_15515:148-1515(+)|eukprot:CAMPEP_0176487710 /NCGR_PEP_ID=MMETSP0200_2-20121128/6291_1 /TAXON_ID=947934 /ORGANISM="Chaetoceros sp., Strain GSL56" /LENGTH=455 /DNA_ID=CAMNT_0017884585 /DNA_START=113 /DNA_END=1480 /DNA_ORIENTATION=+